MSSSSDRVVAGLEAMVERDRKRTQWPPPVDRLVDAGAVVGVRLDLSRKPVQEQVRTVRALLHDQHWQVQRSAICSSVWCQLTGAGLRIEVSEVAADLLDQSSRQRRIDDLRRQLAEAEAAAAETEQ